MARAKAAPTRMQKSGSGHSYYLDGHKVPGVTSILSAGIPKPGLVGWGANAVADFVVNRLGTARNSEGKVRIVADDVVRDALAWNETRGRNAVKVSQGEELPRLALAEILKNVRYRDLDEASSRGTEVHKLAERLISGEEVDVPDELAGHVRSYLLFLEEWDPHDALVETVIVNRTWRYMGKTDLMATFSDVPNELAELMGGKREGRGLVDLKTSRSGIFAETALQCCAYRNGETMLVNGEEVPMEEIDFIGAVHIRSDGYDFVAFRENRDRRPTTFEIFLYAKQVGEWLDWKEGPASEIKTDALRPRPQVTA